MGYEAIRLQRPLAVDDIVSVHYFEYSSNYYFEGERHDFWEFLYVDKGELDVRAGDVVQHLKKGRSFSINRASSTRSRPTVWWRPILLWWVLSATARPCVFLKTEY